MKPLACALAALFAAACVTPPPPVPAKTLPDAKDFYPLVVGSSWTYEVNLLGEKRTQEVSLLKKVSKDGTEFVEDSTGAQLAADRYGVRDQHRYLLRNPIEAGTKWANVVSVSSVEHYEILGVNQPCEAPAGSWQGCVVVESRNQVEGNRFLVAEWTFAPGVGLVQVATSLDDGGKRIPQSMLKLLKFTIAHDAVPVQPPAPAPK